jgi:hypothetical protein
VKQTKSHIVRFLPLLLVVALMLLSSSGTYYLVPKTVLKEVSARKASSTETASKEAGHSDQQVKVAPSIEAVVVSLFAPDFAKEIIFSALEFAPLVEKKLAVATGYVPAEKYFRTLFTHIISPNAP